jgi:CHAT domain-containing protein
MAILCHLEILVFMRFKIFRKFIPINSIIILLICLLSTKLTAQNLADSIYHDLDELVESYPSLISINTIQLKIEEQYSNLKKDEEQLALVIMRCNLGYYLKEYEKHYDAIQQYQKAWRTYNSHALTNYDIIEYCLKPLGNLLTITGNFAEAENIITQYMQIAKSQNDDEAYTAGVINLSVVYNNIGNYQEALELLENHLKKDNLNKNQKELIENNIASNMLALNMHEEVQKEIETAEVRSISSLKNKVQIHIENEEYGKARKLFGEIEALLIKENSPRQLAKFYMEEASFFNLISNKDSAKALLNKALSFLLPNIKIEEIRKNNSLLYPESTLIDIFDAYAQYSEDVNLKLEYYKLSFYVEELLLAKINDVQSKLIFQTSYRKRSENCLKLLYHEYMKNRNDSLIWEAFQYAEKSKARVLKESAKRKFLLDLQPNDSLLMHKEGLLSAQQSLVGELIRKQLSNPEKAQEKLNQDFMDLSYELSEVQNEIDKKYPKSTKNDLNFSALQQQLKEDGAQMLYFFYGEQDLYSFSIEKESISWRKISLDDNLKNQVIHFIQSFESPSIVHNDIQKYVNNAFKLNKILRQGLNNNQRNLIIIPDGLLSFLPFEALLSEQVNHSNFSKMPFWLKEFKISYNLSSVFYVENQKDLNLESLYGVFPVFKDTERYLRYSEKESELIAGIFDEFFDKSEHATKSNFLNKANQYDILHLSTHAMGGSFSMPPYIEFSDDVLLLPELYAQDYDVSLVVLSACETGVGKIIKGATPMSLARGFQYAGAHNILMTQWQVNDYATSIIMEGFYNKLAKNNSPATSIRNARISYLDDKSISNIEKSPYYWAGFTYYGKLTKEEQRWFDFKYLLKLGFIFIVILLVFYIFKRFQKVKS